MDCVLATSEKSKLSLQLVEGLQKDLVKVLERFAGFMEKRAGIERDLKFEKVEWSRDGGRHGGGRRFQAPAEWSSHADKTSDFKASDLTSVSCFERPINAASSNISQVHYEDIPEKKLASATAISSIVHPAHPLLPSLHLHISWTEYKSGSGYWRIMADLNPSHFDSAEAHLFRAAIEQACAGGHVAGGENEFASGTEQGDLYFQIPALGRTRGVVHFYLEEYSTGSFENDLSLAKRCGTAAIESYGQLLEKKALTLIEPTREQLQAQVDYHTLYLFQVLTLDRGTTAGLLVHSDNDVGILGSLPARVNPSLLKTWKEKVPVLQKKLVEELLRCLEREQSSSELTSVTVPLKIALAQAVRDFYSANPAALEIQAQGKILPPTIDNHLKIT